jgi:hypothetical protein
MRISDRLTALSWLLLASAALGLSGCSPAGGAVAGAQEADSQEEPPEAAQTSPVAQDAEQYQTEMGEAEQPAQWVAIEAHNNATRGPRQPIPFNHRFHYTDLQIDCWYCHTGTESSVAGIIPPIEVCMGCHRIAGSGLPPVEELRGYSARGENIPWEWVNKLPDHVQFNHQPHVRSAIECAECHGPVEEMDRVYQWNSFRMGFCLECHRQPAAETDVATDYLLSLFPPPPTPEGLQEHSLYPYAIDSQYGATRGPIDCASCHF